MKITCSRDALHAALRSAKSVAGMKSTMPVLACALLRAEKGRVDLLATDLDVSITVTLDGAKITKPGCALVSVASLATVIAGLDAGGDLTLTADPGPKGKPTVLCAQAGAFSAKLPLSFPIMDFPRLPAAPVMSDFAQVDSKILREMIDKTIFSVSNDETSFHLNGVLFESDGAKGRMVSTDGHRLSKIERTLTGGPQLATGVIIPKKGLAEIKRTIDGVSGACDLAVQGPYVFVRTGDIALAVKLIESQFPPYEQVIPASSKRSVTIDRERLLKAVTRMAKFTSNCNGLRLGVRGGQFYLFVDHAELGKLEERLPLLSKTVMATATTSCNPRYLTDFASRLSCAEITLRFENELDPISIQPADDPDYIGVVMPMRE